MDKVTNSTRMILRILLFVFLVSALTSCKAQPADTNIKILNGSVFQKNSTIKYQVLCPKTVFYFLSLEKYMDGRWQEIVLDISSKAPQQAAVLKKAVAAKPGVGEFKVETIPGDYLSGNHEFRLKLNYGASPVSVNKVVLSTKFQIKSF
jgi:hypothetical protein